MPATRQVRMALDRKGLTDRKLESQPGQPRSGLRKSAAKPARIVLSLTHSLRPSQYTALLMAWRLEWNGTDGALSTSPQTLSGELSGHLHSRVRFRPALDDSRLHTIGAVAYLMIRDRSQHDIRLPKAPLGADSAGPRPERVQRLSGPLQAQLSR